MSGLAKKGLDPASIKVNSKVPLSFQWERDWALNVGCRTGLALTLWAWHCSLMHWGMLIPSASSGWISVFCIIYLLSQTVAAVSLLSIKIHNTIYITQILLGKRERLLWLIISGFSFLWGAGLLNPRTGDCWSIWVARELISCWHCQLPICLGSI